MNAPTLDPLSLVRVRDLSIDEVAEALGVRPGDIHRSNGIFQITRGDRTIAWGRPYSNDSVSELLFASRASTLSERFADEQVAVLESGRAILSISHHVDGHPFMWDQIGTFENSCETLGAFAGDVAMSLQDLRHDGDSCCLSASLLRGASGNHDYSDRMGNYVGDCEAFVRGMKYELHHECRSAIVHGDLTPRNILTSSEGLFLIDFEYAHYGCLYSELGKLVCHGGFLDAPDARAVVALYEGLESSLGDLDFVSLLVCALLWAADYRWVATAVARGRPELVRFAQIDLRRLSLLGHDHWAVKLLRRSRGT